MNESLSSRLGAAPGQSAPGRATETPCANSIFQQPWWLDAVAPDCWAEVAVHRDKQTAARLPFMVREAARLRVLTQPPLTQTLGPWVARSSGAKETTALSDEMKLLTELEAALPHAHAFRQNFSPRMFNALPFYWADYRLETRYTYRIDGLQSEQALWDGLGSNIRGHIRKALKRGVEVREGLALDRFHEVLSQTFERQGRNPPKLDLVERIEAACAPRGARAMLFAFDKLEQIHAVAYVVWDHNAAYYILSGADPELRASGAQSLLLWEAILRARRVTDVFDFEGSMLKPVERFFRDFGGHQTPYLHVSRASMAMRAALATRANINKLANHAHRRCSTWTAFASRASHILTGPSVSRTP